MLAWAEVLPETQQALVGRTFAAARSDHGIISSLLLQSILGCQARGLGSGFGGYRV